MRVFPFVSSSKVVARSHGEAGGQRNRIRALTISPKSARNVQNTKLKAGKGKSGEKNKHPNTAV